MKSASEEPEHYSNYTDLLECLSVIHSLDAETMLTIEELENESFTNNLNPNCNNIVNTKFYSDNNKNSNNINKYNNNYSSNNNNSNYCNNNNNNKNTCNNNNNENSNGKIRFEVKDFHFFNKRAKLERSAKLKDV